MMEGILSMLDQLSDQMGRETTCQLVEIYAENSLQQVRKIETAQARGDSETVRKEAHSLKSSSANLGALQLSDLCAKIEKSGSVASFEELKALHREAVQDMRLWAESEA